MPTMFAVRVSILSYLCYFFLFFHFFPIFFIPFFLSFFFFLFLFFYHALFHTVGSFLGLPARSPFRGVMWSHVSAACECEGRGKKGSLHPSFAAAPLARALNAGRGSRLAARFTRYKARFSYDRCWRKKKISDHSNHMETGLKLESLLAGYSRDVLRRPSFSYLAIIK